MTRPTWMVLALILMATVTVSIAQGFVPKKTRIGTKAPAFQELPGTDDKSYSLSDFAKKDVLVLAVTCNECPVAQAYEGRIKDFVAKHAKADAKVGFLAVCVNDRDEDRLPEMKKRAKAEGLTYPYAYDASQGVASALGAQITPEFFVFDQERKLIYAGPMDDSDEKPTENYVELAVSAALKGQKPAVSEKPVAKRGCGIKWAVK